LFIILTSIHFIIPNTDNYIFVGGADSPPEPAPSELPMRMNGALRPLKPYGHPPSDMDGDSEHGGYHIQPGSGLYLPQGKISYCSL